MWRSIVLCLLLVMATAACSDDTDSSGGEAVADEVNNTGGDNDPPGPGDTDPPNNDEPDADEGPEEDAGPEPEDVGGEDDAGAESDAQPPMDDAQEAEDVADEDAADEDAVDEDAVEEDVVEDTLTAIILAPDEGATAEEGEALALRAEVRDSRYGHDELAVRWLSDLDGQLWAGTPDEQGNVEINDVILTPGAHRLTLEARNPSDQVIFLTRRVAICAWSPVENFNADLEENGWEVFGDAFWDPGGWLEMTGILMGRKGAIFNTANTIAPGDIAIRFRIWTGGGTGADGFAMSVFNANGAEDLRTIVNSAGSGGALGYGVGGNWGDWDGDAFHIEFDTWYNQLNNVERHTDPTRENHIAVMLNGDPGTHHLWAEIPNIEDQQWHDVEINVNGASVLVLLDGAVVIDGQIDGLNFKGGYIGFSGTTGFYTNFHRIDDLQVREYCGPR